MVPARIDESRWRSMSGLRLRRGPTADAVGADHGGAGDELRHGRQQLGVAIPYLAVGLHQVALDDAQQQHQGRGREEGDQRQPPVVDQHDDGGDDDHRPVEQPGDAAPGEELAEGLDVGGDPGHQRAPPFLLVVGQVHGQDVVEDPHAQPVERLLGPDGQPDDRPPHGHGADRDDDGGDGAQDDDPSHVDLAVDEALVDRLLDEDRYDDAPTGAEEGQHHGEGGAAAELGAGSPSPLHRLERAPQRRAVGLGPHCRSPSAPTASRSSEEPRSRS